MAGSAARRRTSLAKVAGRPIGRLRREQANLSEDILGGLSGPTVPTSKAWMVCSQGRRFGKRPAWRNLLRKRYSRFHGGTNDTLNATVGMGLYFYLTPNVGRLSGKHISLMVGVGAGPGLGCQAFYDDSSVAPIWNNFNKTCT